MSAFDPVSEFLAREEEALGDLSEEITKGSNLADGWDNPIDQNTTNAYVILNGDSAGEQFYDGPEPFDPLKLQDKTILGGSYTNGVSTNEEIGETNIEESSKDSENESWRKDFELRIQKKDAEEELRKEELAETGKQELQNWYKHYQEQLAKRSRELREKQDSLNNGERLINGSKPSVNDVAVWENICNMCDFQSKQKGALDMSRMRNILLSLKTNS